MEEVIFGCTVKRNLMVPIIERALFLRPVIAAAVDLNSPILHNGDEKQSTYSIL